MKTKRTVKGRRKGYWKEWPSMKRAAFLNSEKGKVIAKRALAIANEYAQDGAILPLRDAIINLILTAKRKKI